jgi:hypothetical protein
MYKTPTMYRAFNIFQVYQYFTIYRWYFLLNFEQFLWISCATLFKIKRYQRPSQAGKSTWCHPLLKGPNVWLIIHFRDTKVIKPWLAVVTWSHYDCYMISLWLLNVNAPLGTWFGKYSYSFIIFFSSVCRVLWEIHIKYLYLYRQTP